MHTLTSLVQGTMEEDVHMCAFVQEHVLYKGRNILLVGNVIATSLETPALWLYS